MRRLIGGLIALVLTASAGSSHAEPALWAVHGKDSTVYLFGTVHVLRKDAAWRSPKIDAAFALSKDLWLEIADGDDPKASQDLMESLGMDRAHPLSTKIPPADAPRLGAVAKALGAPGGEVLFEPMQPWFAALTISLAPIVAAGYDPQSGVDRVLKAQAVAAGKPVRGFETASGQLHYLSDLPTPLQVQFLESALDDFDKGPAKLDTLVADWTRGDVAAIAGSELDDMKVKQPQIYKTLLADRNARFAAAIAERLKTPGVSFVAVGAAHLAGPDSVQARLAELGVKAERE
ncbi:TraB/GumN family protein [soil metagenome]